MDKVLGVLVGLFFSMVAFAGDEITGKVVSVIDGNTVEVIAEDNETYKILLHGIDCPELEQEYGDKARKLLERLALKKNVQVKIQGKDRWGNRLGVLVIDGKEDPRYELLKEGLAWTSERNPIEELEQLKESAREKSKGLWKDENPTPPWIFRRQQTMTQPKSS